MYPSNAGPVKGGRVAPAVDEVDAAAAEADGDETDDRFTEVAMVPVGNGLGRAEGAGVGDIMPWALWLPPADAAARVGVAAPPLPPTPALPVAVVDGGLCPELWPIPNSFESMSSERATTPLGPVEPNTVDRKTTVVSSRCSVFQFWNVQTSAGVSAKGRSTTIRL